MIASKSNHKISNMDYKKLAELLFPEIDKTPEHYEKVYPERNLPDGAKVTRLGPSPTGFIHLGNLYGAFAGERLAHLSSGIFYLRIEDTDHKREVEGAIPSLIEALDYFGIRFDEGAGADGDKGDYGPYKQSERAEIYQCYAKSLVEQGAAYPCFCTEEELDEIRQEQEKVKANPGYYGKWAKHRDLSFDEIKEKKEAGMEYVIRLRSSGNPEKYFTITDGIRGELSMPENEMDVVILKKTGIPTYHFAHVVDDHLMRTTHVVRGEEWLSSLPIHFELFNVLGFKLPVYCHTTVLMKMDGETKRKLSKRKDPELSLDYYKRQGYIPEAVSEYILTILNSNFEEWRFANPEADICEFEFSTEKMSNSGTLFDLDKLNDVSKETLSRMSAACIYDYLADWAELTDEKKYKVISDKKEMLLKVLDIDRTGAKPRKDLAYCCQIFEFIKYFFDEYFVIEDELPEQVGTDVAKEILQEYMMSYQHSDNQEEWFGKIREMGSRMGYAAKPKDYKKNPEEYKGHVGHVSTVIRIALTGRSNSPDIWEIQQILGQNKVFERIEKYSDALK